MNHGVFNAAGLPYEAHVAAAQELLQLSIQAAGATQAAEDSICLTAPSPATAAATAATAAAAVIGETAFGGNQQQQQQQQQQQGLRLRSFSSSLPKAVDILAALQVQHLTAVDLGFHGAMKDSSTLSLALAQLSNLHQLRLGGTFDASLGAALMTLAQLPQLTSLELTGQWPCRHTA
jgi:hypothetical protein